MVTDSGRRGDLFDPACPTRHLLDRIGDKWTSMIVTTLAAADPDEVRFNELRRRVPGVSHKMLAQTLRGLIADGLVRRRVEATVPPQVFYGLTDLGRSLDVPLAALREWAETHMAAVARHRAAADWPHGCAAEPGAAAASGPSQGGTPAPGTGTA
ncbi:transcriptional regulator, HxlR family [Jatrophihabitans endophyticus]|uniref:Transcriptional regulator, HxlR family n=1 Tax=Jatrophihabitans endophyticus TaxID=1206085 RepID=A0A1M5SPH8_9ACTN|nr:helix-turn-helix domain-containing protein [Jatrophihabitans endophyticus]SHH40365.1 transcriptional regulator, HxlR family [Jatrophihabitans endophyticus]